MSRHVLGLSNELSSCEQNRSSKACRNSKVHNVPSLTESVTRVMASFLPDYGLLRPTEHKSCLFRRPGSCSRSRAADLQNKLALTGRYQLLTAGCRFGGTSSSRRRLGRPGGLCHPAASATVELDAILSSSHQKRGKSRKFVPKR